MSPIAIQQCDYLIIGGGSAGSIIARRLADANIGSVILLEAGKSDEKDPSILDLSLLDRQGAETEWGFLASPIKNQPQQIYYSRAKMLGGCGGHNDCAFLKPPDYDFDNWASLGASGWSAEDVKPYFKNVESMVEVEINPPVSPVSSSFLQAGRELGLTDINFRDNLSAGIGPFPLNSFGDKRQSASVAYLHPLEELPKNLTVICHSRANKLIFNGNTAVGCLTDDFEFRANKEVILTCGAIQSPQLLMISGVGPAAQLSEFGIDVLNDLPGVGSHLIDHACANVIYALKQPAPDWQLTPCEVTMLLQVGKNQPAPDLLYHFVLSARVKYVNQQADYADRHCVKISPNVTRPKSLGELRLKSADINQHPAIDLNYFSDAENYDIETIIQGIRYARKIGETAALKNIFQSEISPGKEINSDTEIANYVRSTCETVYHPAGTCQMGDLSHKNTVVSPDLKVKNLERLRICDASVFPSMVSVNINNTVMMIAEKAAQQIISDQQSQQSQQN